MKVFYFIGAALTLPLVTAVLRPSVLVVYSMYVFYYIPCNLHHIHAMCLMFVLGSILQSAIVLKPFDLDCVQIMYGTSAFFYMIFHVWFEDMLSAEVDQ